MRRLTEEGGLWVTENFTGSSSGPGVKAGESKSGQSPG